MNSTAEKLREAAAYIKDYGVASVMAIARVRDALGVGKTDTTARDLGAVLDTIADELESAEDKAERRKKHIGYLETALHDKNAVLKRRGEAIARVTAENADLRKQVPSERERQILAMWPRFEDGDPVMPGDKVHYASTHNVETEIEVESITVMDGLFVLCDDECRSNQYEQGQRVKRPVQSVLDADGVETKSGDTVYLLKDGDKCRVTGFETIDGEVFARLHCDDRPEIEGARGSAITHRRRVLDADGVEIRAGDTVWFRSLSTGDRMRKATVTGFGEYSLDGPLATLKDEAGGTWHIDPKKITHARPDSWERLEEDAAKHPCVYAEGVKGGKFSKCSECPWGNECDGSRAGEMMARDVIRRAKALAGIGEGE